MSNPLRIFIIGGRGKVAQHLTRSALSSNHTVFSLIRSADHSSDLPDGAQPVVGSIEDLSPTELGKLIKDKDASVVVFAAGSGGKGGPERTKAVDEKGAIKVFDAIESTHGTLSSFRRLILVSAIDSRDLSIVPPWYSEADLERSRKARDALGVYYVAKHAADANLAQRKSFPWIVLRPSTLKDEAGTGKVSLGEQKGITTPVPREDVGSVLLKLAELPKGQGDGLMWDLTSGEKDVGESVEEAVKRGRTDWVG